MSFSPDRLRAELDPVLRAIGRTPSGLCIALSGGLDSCVLLAALAQSGRRREAGALRAIHVDHRLHQDSACWSAHSVTIAARHDVDCEVVEVDARPRAGASPEATAREARYGALAERLRPDEVLLTAHHGDDQLETVLLQCLRGGGLRALAGMRPLVPFGHGWLARPLLAFTRLELEAWARAAALDWLEDPSNRDLRYDRNYLRSGILPLLRARWPAAASTVGRVSRQAAEALDLDEQAAAADLARARQGATLFLPELRALLPARQRRLLRAWLRASGLPTPPAATLEALRRDTQAAAADRVPEVRWPGAIVHRYRERLYAEPEPTAADAWSRAGWRAGEMFDLGSRGHLELRAARGVGLSRVRLAGPLEVIPRPAGAEFKPAGSVHHRSLRKWLQERGVLPWQRSHLPVVVAGSVIVAVGDLAYGGELVAAQDEASWQIVWHGRPLLTEAEATTALRGGP